MYKKCIYGTTRKLYILKTYCVVILLVVFCCIKNFYTITFQLVNWYVFILCFNMYIKDMIYCIQNLNILLKVLIVSRPTNGMIFFVSRFCWILTMKKKRGYRHSYFLCSQLQICMFLSKYTNRVCKKKIAHLYI